MDKNVHVYKGIKMYTVGYYSAIKKKEILLLAAIKLKLEGILLSVISQTEKDNYYIISFTCGI